MMLKKKDRSKKNIHKIVHEAKEITDPPDIAEAFKSSFCKHWPKIGK